MSDLKLLIILVLCVYGFFFGVRNFYIRCSALYDGKSCQQGVCGIFLDMAWLTTILFYLIKLK